MEPAHDPGLEQVPVSSALNPRLIGQRVVVRAVVPGETGPTGGPAFTDTLGLLENWSEGILKIRTADDDVVEIPASRVVSGKPVPPRPSRFSRISTDEVERRCMAFSRSVEVEELGDWQFRFLGGGNPLANAVLAVGDPGVRFDEAIARAERFYGRNGRRPVARVVADSATEHQLKERSWSLLDADQEVHLAGVAALARRLSDIDVSAVVYEDRLSRDWLVGNERAQANFDVVALSLDLPIVTFGSISQDMQQVARARINISDGWAYLADLTVAPSHRGRGLSRSTIAGMTQWAAERGASVMALQVRADNEPAKTLYADLDFERHHAYRYLAAPT